MSPDVEAAIVKLAGDTAMTDADLRDLLCARSLQDVRDLAAIYEAAGRPLDLTTRQRIVAEFGSVVDDVQAVMPLVGFLQQLATL